MCYLSMGILLKTGNTRHNKWSFPILTFSAFPAARSLWLNIFSAPWKIFQFSPFSPSTMTDITTWLNAVSLSETILKSLIMGNMTRLYIEENWRWSTANCQKLHWNQKSPNTLNTRLTSEELDTFGAKSSKYVEWFLGHFIDLLKEMRMHNPCRMH